MISNHLKLSGSKCFVLINSLSVGIGVSACHFTTQHMDKQSPVVEEEIETKRKQYADNFFPNGIVKTVNIDGKEVCDIDYYYGLFDRHSRETNGMAIDLLAMHPQSPLNPKAEIDCIIPNSPNSTELSPNRLLALHLAASKGHIGVCKFLLDKGAAINELSGEDHDETPLYAAIQYSGNKEVVKLLLQQNNIDPNIQGKRRQTVLHRAVYLRDEESIKLLLQCDKTDPNIQKNQGETALSVANEKIVQVLLQYDIHGKIDPNIQDHRGWTPLHKAANWGMREVARLLLQHDKIDPNIRSYRGNTPLEEAISLHPEIAYLLLQHSTTDPNIDKHLLDHITSSTHWCYRNRVMLSHLMKTHGHKNVCDTFKRSGITVTICNHPDASYAGFAMFEDNGLKYFYELSISD